MKSPRSYPYSLLILCLLFAAGRANAGAPAPARAQASVIINAGDTGLEYQGAGAISASSSRLLYDYPEPERSRILDYLFSPAYGGMMQILKVEIGSDMNSTDLAEPSHMRAEGVVDDNLGFEWWLMAEAKKRNPNIKLSALAWGAPGWVGGTFWTDKTIDYLLSWLELARKKGFTIDYIGGWNERSWDAAWYVKFGAKLKARFPHVKLVAADDVKDRWSVAFEMLKNRELREAVDIIGVHSPAGWRGEYKESSSPAELRALPQPLWNSEHSSMTHDLGAMPLARAMNRLYPQSRIVANLCWSLTSAWYSSLPIADTGLLLAEWPWSGYYQTGKSIWAYAHTTQFTEPGWRHMDNASGFLPNGASYVTRKSPDNARFSTVVETCDATRDITVEFALQGMPAPAIHVWKTDLVSDDDNDHFIQTETIKPVDGKYTLTFKPGCVYTITNTTGQARGAAKPRAKIDDMMPLPYSEDFESYGPARLARFFCDLNGAFETAKAGGGRAGMAYRQMIKQKPVSWRNPVPDPSSVIGDPRWWGDYEVASDVLFEEPGYIELLGRVSVQWNTHIGGYHLRLHNDGKWELYSQESDRLGDPHRTLATGAIAINPDQWNRVALRMKGAEISAVFNGKVATTVADDLHISGQAGILASQWIHAQFDNFKIEKTAPWPVFVPVADMKVAAFTSEQTQFHRGYSYLAKNAIDGRPETSWYCDWPGKARLPQSVTIDLGKPRPLAGVVYQPRRDTGNIIKSTNGYITKCKVYVSDDNRTFHEVAQAQFKPSHASRLITWDSSKSPDARYIKFEALEGTGNEASIGELNIITTPAAPAPDQNILMADPYILEDNGAYYLYGTGAKNGIAVWRSTDLKTWDGPCGATDGLALHKKNTWGARNFWAPEVYKINGKYIMTYSVDSHIALAESASPLGPFVQPEKKPLLDEPGIDSHIFIDDDGTPHLYWVRFQHGNIIWTARMSRDLRTVDMSTARRCITPQPGTWERTPTEPRANVAEGPFVIKRAGKYYLTYSCNHYKSPDYAVGWAVSDTPEGPWTRGKPNPILLRHDGYTGTGHHAFLQTASGKLYIVYHAHNTAGTISPRRTLISECRWDKPPGFATVLPGSFELTKK